MNFKITFLTITGSLALLTVTEQCWAMDCEESACTSSSLSKTSPGDNATIMPSTRSTLSDQELKDWRQQRASYIVNIGRKAEKNARIKEEEKKAEIAALRIALNQPPCGELPPQISKAELVFGTNQCQPKK